MQLMLGLLLLAQQPAQPQKTEDQIRFEIVSHQLQACTGVVDLKDLEIARLQAELKKLKEEKK